MNVGCEVTALQALRKVLSRRNRSSPTTDEAGDLVSRRLPVVNFMCLFSFAKTTLMTSPLDALKTCTNLDSLRSTLQALCAPLGAVAELEVFRVEQAGHLQVMCVWRMQSEKENARIMQTWGVGRFGGELVAVVDVTPVTLNDHT